MKINRRITALAVTLAATAAMVAGCTSSTSASKAQSAQNSLSGTTASEFSSAVPYPFAHQQPSDPLERKNLAKRLKQLNSKGATNYVYLFTYSGQVLGYYVISGKVSSTGSQMTSTQVNVGCNGNTSCTDDAIGDDGSYGPSEGGQNGVFFFTSTGTLVETNQPWVMSSTPIKLYASVPQLDSPVAPAKP